jgi:hypothetical protein
VWRNKLSSASEWFVNCVGSCSEILYLNLNSLVLEQIFKIIQLMVKKYLYIK